MDALSSKEENQPKRLNLFDIIKWFDDREPWVTNSDKVNQSANEVIREMELLKEEVEVFETYEEFIQLINMAAYLKFDIFVQMFAEMGIKQNGFGGDVIVVCSDGLDESANNAMKPEMNVILQRISLIIKTELLNKVFGKENRGRVLKAIEDLRNDGVITDEK